MSALPPGLTTRPLCPADARAVFELMAAQELADTGSVEIEEADLVSDWARPSHDLGASSVAVLDGETMVGYAELIGHERADAAVLPSHRGRGIGTWLAAWLRDLARRRGHRAVGMPVPVGSAGDRLLAALGYRVRWTSWVLALPNGATILARDLPAGHTVRQATEAELPALHDVLEDAFLEWADRERESFEDFAPSVLQRPGFAPWNLRVVTGPGGEIVAGALVFLAGEGATASVARIAVRRDRRGQGLAQVLLVDAFGVARDHGAARCELSTDSRTGALGLYESVGMVVTQEWVSRATDL